MVSGGGRLGRILDTNPGEKWVTPGYGTRFFENLFNHGRGYSNIYYKCILYIYIENTWLAGFTSSHVVLCVYLFVLPSGKLT